ncbi:PspC domain-containing protein [Psychrobacillus vulpis]|uniref:PspC domain-containing protein n=1 Tax=Psychrobacillus vulpis TaxID=2325572 RepID=A0A544TDM7_9BACI|nr:PspC domain-containing protein [Psychrobacillus vulpis]TQR15506.1 PspC domain-containing protein [Psychrobacillus vulpis]
MQKLKKSSKDRVLRGVCGVVAEFFGISSTIIRLIFFFTGSISFIVYLFLAVTLENDNKLY